MLGSQVLSDLDAKAVSEAVPTFLPWGATFFDARLRETTADRKILKARQLPLAALKKESELNNTLRGLLSDLKPAVDDVEACIGLSDPLAEESIQQIYYSKTSTANPLNSNSTYLRAIMFWKTLFLPGFSILAPLLGMIVPFFLLKLFGKSMGADEYLGHLRASILKQISVPTMFRARGDGDRLGGFFEMLFVGFTLIMFISGIWNQVSNAIHLRSIYARLSGRGDSVQRCLSTLKSALDHLRGSASSRAFKDLIRRGSKALTDAAHFMSSDGAATAGSLWNNPDAIFAVRDILGELDAYTALGTLPSICIVKYTGAEAPLSIKGLVHPALSAPVQNDYESTGHTILTGPNRGGKSTFCKALGLAILTAQSWGFAWASSVSLVPFAAIHTALEPAGKLGFASTFEAEIVFAKKVLDEPAQPMFVMMDEIFHSTNAVDGVRASKVFMSSLYAKQSVYSIISTHYRDLASHFGETAEALQLVATGEDGDLVYTYKLAMGISTKSSVDELLRIHGLLPPALDEPGAETGAKKDSQLKQNK